MLCGSALHAALSRRTRTRGHGGGGEGRGRRPLAERRLRFPLARVWGGRGGAEPFPASAPRPREESPPSHFRFSVQGGAGGQAAMGPVLLHVVFEHAAGYALFALRQAEEVALLLPQVEESVLSLGKFLALVRLVAFAPFKSAQSALENIHAVSEGLLHEDLRLLLETHLPAKRKKAVLGVSDAKIGAAIQEELGCQCQTGGVVAEITRGIRLHFCNLIKGLTSQSASKAQLGLGHTYSRAKVKFNVNRVDNMIIQSISLLDQLDKDINTFSMRVREWYGYHFPELIKIVSDNYTYCRLAKLIRNRKELSEESLEELEEVVMDSAKAQAILEASRSSMGMDISPIDLINIERFSSRVISLSEYRKSLQEYLRSKMSQVAPSLSALIGEVVGARLISHAGSLTNLAKYPASTVQILGAEKALFRALKTRGNTPKYGLIFHSTFIGRAAAKNKGRISRYLANKCSIASRIDCFSEVPTCVFGDKLREQVEERLAFYETGEPPRKNLDVMKAAVVEATAAAAEIRTRLEKREKKKRKRERQRQEALGLEAPAEENEAEPKKKKKRKRQEEVEQETELEPAENGLEPEAVPKKKKKKTGTLSPLMETPERKKQKKKKVPLEQDSEEAD
ncbi:nucleolar protein 56 [Paroedura picta]|uniref:nucleolar protein 56 n=1 Tax=Paroedura picta TaxID=143630 RepID=UPI004056E9AD